MSALDIFVILLLLGGGAVGFVRGFVYEILSLLAWHDIPAYARNIEHIRTSCPLTLALGGMPIQVLREFADEARELLAEAAERENEARVEPLEERVLKVLFCGVLGLTPPPKVSAAIVGR